MAVRLDGPKADLKRVQLKYQTPTSKSGVAILHPVQPLQKTLVSPDGECPPKEVHTKCFNSQSDCKALSLLWHISLPRARVFS